VSSRVVAIAALFAVGVLAPGPARVLAQAAAPASFAARVAALSEPSGYFDTDNLISNERSYLHVVPVLRELTRGGAYIGVGPDQNFSYIAHARPAIAFLVDIRRDNLLLHLLFKALFAHALTRVEYLALWTGRAPPSPIAGWESKTIDQLVQYIDRAPARTADQLKAIDARIATAMRGFGVPLSPEDLQTIAGFHRQFIDDGLSLQFHSAGRPPQFNYPTLRDLLLEVDRAGTRRSYLASEDDFQFVKSLQAKDLVIPVVGDLSGTHALAAIGRLMTEQKQTLSVFYASNVEFYLFDGSARFRAFIANLGKLPHDARSTIVRSVFTRGVADPGYNSASMTQSIEDLLSGYASGRYRQYGELISASR